MRGRRGRPVTAVPRTLFSRNLAQHARRRSIVRRAPVSGFVLCCPLTVARAQGIGSICQCCDLVLAYVHALGLTRKIARSYVLTTRIRGSVPLRSGATRRATVGRQDGPCRLYRFARHSVRATPQHTPSGDSRVFLPLAL